MKSKARYMLNLASLIYYMFSNNKFSFYKWLIAYK